MMRLCLPTFLLYLLSAAFNRQPPATGGPAPAARLSDYRLFTGNPADQVPAPGVIPYSLNTPLFSNYAEKLRFMKLPEDSTLTYRASGVLDFPKGTILVKTFYYPVDFRDPSRGRRLLETRLLLNEPAGWKAYTYIWNEEMTDAVLEIAGEKKLVNYTYLDGRKYRHEYLVPNLNQCKGCHNKNNAIEPIGPTAGQLNGRLHNWGSPESSMNQLEHLQRLGLLADFPPGERPPLTPAWDNPAASLNDRARAWLDVNCAHCHRPEGPANSSGLYLGLTVTDSTRLGFGKTPVAAGRGSGGRRFDIVKGKPESSILIYRMESEDPGEMMPEIGRQVAHREGISLIKEWIKHMR